MTNNIQKDIDKLIAAAAKLRDGESPEACITAINQVLKKYGTNFEKMFEQQAAFIEQTGTADLSALANRLNEFIAANEDLARQNETLAKENERQRMGSKLNRAFKKAMRAITPSKDGSLVPRFMDPAHMSTWTELPAYLFAASLFAPYHAIVNRRDFNEVWSAESDELRSRRSAALTFILITNALSHTIALLTALSMDYSYALNDRHIPKIEAAIESLSCPPLAIDLEKQEDTTVHCGSAIISATALSWIWGDHATEEIPEQEVFLRSYISYEGYVHADNATGIEACVTRDYIAVEPGTRHTSKEAWDAVWDAESTVLSHDCTEYSIDPTDISQNTTMEVPYVLDAS